MGSIFKPKAPPPPPPPPPAPTIRDEIGGTEQVAMKNADGTTTYVTRRLPLTKEQQAQQNEYKRIMQEALGEIEKLSDSKYKHDKSTQEILDIWKVERDNILDESFSDRRSEEEKILARRGLADSSAANSIRRQRRLDRQQARDQIQREQTMLAGDIRSQKLGVQQNLFNLASSRQDLDMVKAQRSASSGISAFGTLDASNRASIADYYNRQLGYNSRLQNVSPSLFGGGIFGNAGKTVGGTVGTTIGGPVGGAVGTVLGGVFGKLF